METNSAATGRTVRRDADATPAFGPGTQIEYGIVREIDTVAGQRTTDGDHRSANAYGVEITAPGACDQCLIKDNCYGSGAVVWAQSSVPLAVGDNVRLEMRPGTVLKATGWVYGIPLLALAAGLLLGYYLLFRGLSDQLRVLLSAALSFGLMIASGTLLARFNAWIGRRITIEAYPSGTNDTHDP